MGIIKLLMSSGGKRDFLAVPETGWSCADPALPPLVVPDLLSPDEMGEVCVLGTPMAQLSPRVPGLGQVWCLSAHL